MKIYGSAEVGHREAVRLLHGPSARKVRHATSMLVAVELISVLARTIGDAALIGRVLRQLESFRQTELTERHRDLAIRLARLGVVRGADTVIAAQALVVCESAGEELDFVTADDSQARLVRSQATARELSLTVTQLAV